MKKTKLSEMKGGWFIGNFCPSVYKSQEFEVAVKSYNAGDVEAKHLHKISTEFTVVISGKVTINDEIILPGTIVELKPGEVSAFKVLEDAITIVVKVPSIQNDKYII